MVEDLKIEPRVTWGNIIPVVLAGIGGIVWFVSIEGNTANNLTRIQSNEKRIEHLEAAQGVQYAEIIRRLEGLQEQQIEHIGSHK